MGCNNSKSDEHVQERLRLFFWRKRNKVMPMRAEHFVESDAENTVRRTQATVLLQLKAEGIVPKKGNGGVAFVVNMSEPSPSTILPGIPECECQYTTYSQTSFPSGNLPPRRLPPINSRDGFNYIAM
ncbi:uncharacterized protein [Argopecten irradians]|uniref:uncharacterized protein n=1 Tax=Argopecten irradians TaxID=31199 RepID=UPI00371B95FE